MRLSATVNQFRGWAGKRLREWHFPYEWYMNRHRFVFIHVPKSGGTSLRAALGAPARGRMHLPWYVYHQANPDKYQRFFKAGFFRDPAERAYSAYAYLRRGGNRTGNLEAAEQVNAYADFGEFVTEGLGSGRFFRHTLFLPQAFFLCDYDGRPRVDFIGRTENMGQDGAEILGRLGVRSAIPHDNRGSDKAPPSQALDPAVFEVLQRVYAADYALSERLWGE